MPTVVGDTKPYGLKPPLARPVSDADEHSVYLAVSQAILLGDHITSYMSVGGNSSSLAETQRETLLPLPVFDRVGRTIRIYRLRDLSRKQPLPRVPLPRVDQTTSTTMPVKRVNWMSLVRNAVQPPSTSAAR